MESFSSFEHSNIVWTGIEKEVIDKNKEVFTRQGDFLTNPWILSLLELGSIQWEIEKETSPGFVGRFLYHV